MEWTALEQELALRDGALNASSSYFVIIDVAHVDRPIVFANRAFARDHGYEVSELIGRSVRTLASSEGNEKAAADIEAAITKGAELRAEILAQHRDGTRFTVGIHLSPLLDDTSHYLVVGTDITARLEAERKRNELQQRLHDEISERERLAIELRFAQKLEAVGRLAAGVAHEINTPIQYIGDSVNFMRGAAHDTDRLMRMYDEALTRSLAGEPVAEIAAKIAAFKEHCDYSFLREETPRAFARTLEGVERVTQIVRAMKDFSHPDECVQSQADINHGLQTTLTIASNEFKYVAQAHCDLGDLPAVTCNLGELNQVFLNLIVNAAHAIEQTGRDVGTGRIDIATRRVEDEVEITIADNGCGIRAEDHERVFDPFFTTKEVGKGTGQGLTIARAIVVERHGGRISFESQEGLGTKFIIRLPIEGTRHEVGP